MPLHPLAPLLSLFLGAVSLFVLGYGGWLLWDYWEYWRSREAAEQMGLVLDHVAMRAQLWWGVGMLAFSAFGRPLVLASLGRDGTDDPKPARSTETRTLERPDGAKLHVEFFGPKDAPTILLTHGFSNDSTTWYYLKKLGDRFRLIVWDLRGVGCSKGPTNNDCSLDAMAGDLRALMELATPGQPLLIAGHSMGGMICLTLLKAAGAQFRDRIAGIALLNTTFTNPAKTCALRSLAQAVQKPLVEPLLWLTDKLLWPLVWLQNWSSYQNGTSHILTRLFTFAGRQTRGQLDFCTRMSVRQSPRILSRQMLAMFRYDVTDTLPRIDLPALVLTAPHDKATEPDASEFLHRTLPHATLITIAGTAHASMNEQGDAVRQAVADFADQVFATNRRVEPILAAAVA